ncbi:preprotein translocase subunit SecE [Patescibacteria group bacterium]|nr:preprotein translocase subunit SecE [Patescibacteria group bacterium]
MLDFIYDSLETVKKLKHPTKRDFVNLTIAIFLLVIVAGAYFVAADTVFTNLYKAFYYLMS